MNKTSTTIHDVACHLGISVSTVSFVINGRADKHRISSDTVQRVNRYIKEINYVPDWRAKSFRTRRTRIIGLLLEDFSDRSTIALMKQLEEIAFKKSYKIIVQQIDEEKKAIKILSSLSDKQTEAYLIQRSDIIPDEYYGKMKDHNVPFLFFGFGKKEQRTALVNQLSIDPKCTGDAEQMFAELEQLIIKKNLK